MTAKEVKPRVQRVACVCLTCGGSFEVLPSQHRDGRGKYCSHACSHGREASQRPTRKRVNARCQVCDCEFEVKAYRKDEAKYCSYACYNVARHSPKKTCACCGVEYIASKALRNGSPAGKKYCSRECLFKTLDTSVEKQCLECGSAYRVKKYREHTSSWCSRSCVDSWRAKAMSLGLLKNPYNAPTRGEYTSTLTGEEETYDSLWELERMVQLDALGESWTKKHGIVIPYIDESGKERKYVPDFLVGTRLEEIKPLFKMKDSRIVEKHKAALFWCFEHGYDFVVMTEEDLFVD